MPRDVPKRHPLDQSRLYSVQSRGKLAALFHLTRAGLDAIVEMERPYTTWPMKDKRSGKTRIIQQPRGGLRPIHAYVSQALSRISPPDFLFCPVKRRSYVSNAAQHAGAKEIRTLARPEPGGRRWSSSLIAAPSRNSTRWLLSGSGRCSR
jgi:hypothetical protein